ncbi:hypothetical protein LA364_17555 [Aeromonas enteropelogenes]|uniref:hypothetical protein n=1 Tax=Aeromonas enteropelogenes TaxID=29489 RepID=UPI001CE2AE32|nr:hypothetical protein [Aeromonas enteropelogenes]UCA10450.1 hypothetical protein LA364_17555 [Aeromonas enteropelogenes]
MKFLGYIIAFLFGAIIEATEYQFLVKDVKWTDIISVIATVVTTIIIYFTYSKWLDSKKREDAYQTSKDYISCLVDISELLDNLMSPFEQCVPQAGGIPLKSKQSDSLLANSNEALHKLLENYKRLARTKSELRFWEVSLAPEFEKKHVELLQEISSIYIIADALQSQVYWYYNVDESKQGCMFDEFSKLKARVVNANKLLSSRYNRRYADFFVYTK